MTLRTLTVALYLDQVHDHKSLHPNEPITTKAFGEPANVQNSIKESVKTVKSFIGMLQSKMELYLANPDTQYILYKPIKVNI